MADLLAQERDKNVERNYYEGCCDTKRCHPFRAWRRSNFACCSHTPIKVLIGHFCINPPTFRFATPSNSIGLFRALRLCRTVQRASWIWSTLLIRLVVGVATAGFHGTTMKTGAISV